MGADDGLPLGFLRAPEPGPRALFNRNMNDDEMSDASQDDTALPQGPWAGVAGDDDITAVMFPPIPLLTGGGVEDGSGEMDAVVAVTVTLQLASGRQRTVVLREDHGAWWAPSPGPLPVESD